MIVTDLKMPVMDGVEFVKSAKQLLNCKFVPMVMLSPQDDDAKIATARKAGVSTFKKKPINAGQFTAMLKIVLWLPKRNRVSLGFTLGPRRKMHHKIMATRVRSLVAFLVMQH